MPYLECRHIFAGGRKCKAPALTGQPLCYFHHRAAGAKSALPQGVAMQWEIGPLEDADTIQLALSQVLAAIANGQLDARRGGLLLYGLQVAAGNVQHARTYADCGTVREIFPAPDGAAFGPTVKAFDFGEDETECDCPDDCDGGSDCKCQKEVQSQLRAIIGPLRLPFRK